MLLRRKQTGFQASTAAGMPESGRARPFTPPRYQAGRAVLLFEPTVGPDSGTGLMGKDWIVDHGVRDSAKRLDHAVTESWIVEKTDQGVFEGALHLWREVDSVTFDQTEQ